MTEEEIITQLIRLLNQSGHKRLEICRSWRGDNMPGGYCVKEDGTAWHIRNYLPGGKHLRWYEV